jgi:hypothetical protein
MKTLTQSLVVEAALAGLFLAVSAAPALAQDHEKKAEGGDAPMAAKKASKSPMKKAVTVHCLGVNACKGTSACGVDGKHACAGHNACKGQGWIALTKKDCKKQKGTALAEKKAESKTEAAAPAPAAQ